jgi:ParB/RepB/Spo0J family partition protein
MRHKNKMHLEKTISKVNVNQIVEDYHLRRNLTGMEELKKSIEKEKLSEPISVRPLGTKYAVINGKRRLYAVKELGWKEIPCIVEDIDEKTAAHQSYLRNTGRLRKNLNPIEVSLHIKKMRERFGYSVQDLVDFGSYGKKDIIYKNLSLLTLPQEIQEKIAEGKIDPTAGYHLVRLKDEVLQLKLAEEIPKKKDVTRKVEKKVKILIDSKKNEKQNSTIEIPKGDIPGVFFKDSSDMSEFDDGTIPLYVTSANYGVGMEYEEGVTFEEHKKDLKSCLSECGRKGMRGGYMCIIFGYINNYGTRNGTEPEIQVMGHFFQDYLRPFDIRLRDIKIWEKGLTYANNRQVSPYERTKHTNYRHLNNFEYIYIFKKDGKRDIPLDLDLKSKISKKEYYDWVGGIWNIKPVHRQDSHPAEFPEEIPRRLIKMYSCEGDIVVDPALGSGTTVKVANELGRRGIGYERELNINLS